MERRTKKKKKIPIAGGSSLCPICICNTRIDGKDRWANSEREMRQMWEPTRNLQPMALQTLMILDMALE